MKTFDVSAKTGGRYKVDLSRPAFKGLEGHLKEGRLSPRADVNLNEAERRRANISMRATSFAFAYPLVSKLDDTSDKTLFLRNGGYVYFDQSRNLCGLNVMKEGKGLR